MAVTANSDTNHSTVVTSDEGPSPSSDGVAVGLAVVVVGVVALMAAYGEIFFDVLPFVAVFVGLGVWAARSASTKLRWGIAALLVVFVGINMIFAVSDLSHPESPGPFIATVVVIGAGLVTVVLAVSAARGRSVSAGRVWMASAGVLALVMAGSAVAAANVTDAVAQPGDVTIEAADYEFPEQVEVDASSTGFFVNNVDRGRHTFVVEGEIDAVEVPASSAARVDADLAPGTYRYYCDVPGHEAMEGTLVVG